MENRRFTVLTPTYNRRDLLGRVYQNLKNQTYKNFEWLIVDDGSTDGTELYVEEWKKENVIAIRYIKKPNEGKSKTIRLGFSIVETDYVIDFDDDDEYTPNCLEIFNNAWDYVESKGISNIGSIRGLAVRDDGRIVGAGNIMLNSIEGKEPFVDNYINYNIIKANWVENITCYKTKALQDANAFEFSDMWMGSPVMYVSEFVVWSRLAKKYDTLYINKALRIYNEATEGITRNVNYRRRWMSNTYSNLLFLNDMIGQYGSEKLMYMQILFYLGVGSCLCRLPYIKVAVQLHSRMMKNLMISLYPLCFLYGNLLRYFRHQKCY